MGVAVGVDTATCVDTAAGVDTAADVEATAGAEVGLAVAVTTMVVEGATTLTPAAGTGATRTSLEVQRT